MAEMKIGSKFGTPILRQDTYYVECSECGVIEGQFVTALNRLTVGTGTWAEKYIARGWEFSNSLWTCPLCLEGE